MYAGRKRLILYTVVFISAAMICAGFSENRLESGRTEYIKKELPEIRREGHKTLKYDSTYDQTLCEGIVGADEHVGMTRPEVSPVFLLCGEDHVTIPSGEIESWIIKKKKVANPGFSNELSVNDFNIQEILGNVTKEPETTGVSERKTEYDETKIYDYISGISYMFDYIPEEIEFNAWDGEHIQLYNYGGIGITLNVHGTADAVKTALEENEPYVEPVWNTSNGHLTDSVISGKYVEVDISAQEVFFYDDKGGLVMETPCVTGTANGYRDTDQGAFAVYSMESPAVLRGADYESHVQYWMPFNGGEGLHDAPWRGDFGGDIYQWNGSHGCVNLPNWAAETLYNSIEIGTPVIVHE